MEMFIYLNYSNRFIEYTHMSKLINCAFKICAVYCTVNYSSIKLLQKINIRLQPN